MSVTRLESSAEPLHVRCSGCGHLNRDSASFCEGCGRPTTSARADLATDQQSTVGEALLLPPPVADQRLSIASSAAALPPPPTVPPSKGMADVVLPPPPPLGHGPSPSAPDVGQASTSRGSDIPAPPAPNEHESRPRGRIIASFRWLTTRLQPGEGPRSPRTKYVFAAIALGAAVIAVAAIMFYLRPTIETTAVTMPEVALSGEDVTVSVDLVNQGRAVDEHTVTVLVDGQPAESATTSLEAGSDENVDVTIGDLEPGTHELALADSDEFGGIVWVMTAPVFDIPDAVDSGEDVVVDVQVTNAGPDTVSQEVALVAGRLYQSGQVAANPQTARLDLQAGAEQSVQFVFPALDPGDYQLTATIGDWKGPAGSVAVLAPARFEVEFVDVAPNPMDVNDSQEATITAGISNVGDDEGTYALRLELDGETIEERTIDLQGGTSTEEAFLVAVSKPGAHEVAVGDVTVGFEAYQLERPANGTVLTNQISGGRNELRITNNFDEDHVVVLTKPGEGNPALLSVYVRGGASHTVYGIRDGTYTTYYTYGADWCTHNQAFTEGVGYGRYEDDNTFTSSATSYAWVALEFGIAEGPGSPTSSVSEDAFPAK